MRLVSYEVRDAPPIRLFSAGDFSNVVVLAGPNGVGKTNLIKSLIEVFRNPTSQPNRRLVVEATSSDEREQWGTQSLDTSSQTDAAKLRATLQLQKSRGKWTSSLIQFESDRSISQIHPYNFNWDVIDPFSEPISWDTSFNELKNRFQDTMHSIFRKLHSRREEMANRAETMQREGHTSMMLDFTDPLIPFKRAFTQLLAPKELLDPEIKRQALFYQFEGKQLPLSALSSGEREVVNIVFDFILRNPSHSIVIFDEPELHLHPELSYKLLQTLQTVGESNQFIFCTHSPEIITAALDNTVVFVSPPTADDRNQAIPVREDDDTHQALRLLGQSIGIVALGRRIVLVEGTDSSLDKQVYGSILKSRFPSLVLVPSGGRQTITSFGTIVDSILRKTLWGVEFFMLCDRDAVPLHLDPARIEGNASGRLKVLKRYHLENYFLDENILASVFRNMEAEATSWLNDPTEIRTRLRELARDMVSYTAALVESVSFRQNAGLLDLMPKGAHGKTADELAQMMTACAEAEKQRIDQVLDPAKVAESVRNRMEILNTSLEQDTEEWKRLVPGKILLNKFAATARMDVGRLKTMFIREVEKAGAQTFADIVEIFEHFSKL